VQALRRRRLGLLRQLGRPANQLTFSPYPKTGGWMVTFQTDLEGGTWNDYVVDAVELGQRVAHAWSLSGNVRRSPQGWSTKARIAGVTAIQWLLLPHGQEEGTKASDVDL
jgi:hypothetical protein